MSLALKDLKWNFFFCSSLILGLSSSLSHLSLQHPRPPIYHAYINLQPQKLPLSFSILISPKAIKSHLFFLFKALFVLVQILFFLSLLSFHLFLFYYFVHNSQVAMCCFLIIHTLRFSILLNSHGILKWILLPFCVS